MLNNNLFEQAAQKLGYTLQRRDASRGA